MPPLLDYKTQAATIAANVGIPSDLFTSLVSTESSWNPLAVSSAGAVGLTQLMPATAAQLGVNPYDPIQNLQGGATYLKSLFDRFGDWTKALSAYNTGDPNSTVGAQYAKSVLAGTNTKPTIDTTKPPITGNPIDPTGLITKLLGGFGSTNASLTFPTIVMGFVVIALIAFGLYLLTIGAQNELLRSMGA